MRPAEGEWRGGDDTDIGEPENPCCLGDGVLGTGEGDLGGKDAGVGGTGLMLGLLLGGEFCGDAKVKDSCTGDL